MGMYVETNSKGEGWPSPKGKADFLIADGAIEVLLATVEAYQPFLVCVVENNIFDAAGFCYNYEEFKQFFMDQFETRRPRRWLIAEAAVRRNFSESTVAEHLTQFEGKHA